MFRHTFLSVTDVAKPKRLISVSPLWRSVCSPPMLAFTTTQSCVSRCGHLIARLCRCRAIEVARGGAGAPRSVFVVEDKDKYCEWVRVHPVASSWSRARISSVKGAGAPRGVLVVEGKEQETFKKVYPGTGVRLRQLVTAPVP